MLIEQKSRSIAKSLTWRLFSTSNGLIVSYIVLNDIKQSLAISIVANITGMIFYYIHERVWNRISWRRN
ncbi:MAG: DUF2061 domain-containing protein [Nanoarchaeota archaeon]